MGSTDDDSGVKKLLNQTLELIADERVRLFCVAAQVVNVEQKIDAAITECMRLGVHAARTAMVPLPCSGMIGTPTVSRILCEHVLQCFGFPKAMPQTVEEIMSRVVFGNLRQFMAVSLAQFVTTSGAAIGLAFGTAGVGLILGVAGSIMAAPPTARMLMQCACDMILILERSFRYGGKFVSTKQIEDAAKYYTTSTIKTFAGNDKLLQQHVHEEVNRLIPLKKVSVGIKFMKLRGGFEEIVYKNRFDQVTLQKSVSNSSKTQLGELDGSVESPPVSVPPAVPELDAPDTRPELEGTKQVFEMEGSRPSVKIPTRHSKTISDEKIVASPTKVTDIDSEFGTASTAFTCTTEREFSSTWDSQAGTGSTLADNWDSQAVTGSTLVESTTKPSNIDIKPDIIDSPSRHRSDPEVGHKKSESRLKKWSTFGLKKNKTKT